MWTRCGCEHASAQKLLKQTKESRHMDKVIRVREVRGVDVGFGCAQMFACSECGRCSQKKESGDMDREQVSLHAGVSMSAQFIDQPDQEVM